MGTLKRWWWIPLIALVGIFLKALLLVPWVTGKAETAAIDALQANNLGAVEFVEVDGVDGLGGEGLNVVLEGPAADEAAAVAAVAAREEVDKVVYRPIDDGAAAVEPDPEPEDDVEPEPVEEAPAAPVLQPAALGLAATGGAIVLTGEVADEAARAAVVEVAEAEYGAANVTDELVINGDVAADGGELVVTGEAASAAEQTEWLASAGAVASAGGLEVVDRTTVRAVEDQLNALFELEPIEFDVNRSTIRPDSIATLDAAAAAINDNPDAGRFQVVGHTDGDGSAANNQALSEARAEAVVAYLIETGEVDPDRLEALGAGETEPLVEPEMTPEDKQRNRRIEWRRLS